MGLNISNRPEQDYFTFDELGDRWNCTGKVIEHHIFEKKILKAGINISELAKEDETEYFVDLYSEKEVEDEISAYRSFGATVRVNRKQCNPELTDDIYSLEPAVKYYNLNLDFITLYVEEWYSPKTETQNSIQLVGTDFLIGENNEIYRIFEETQEGFSYRKFEVGVFDIVLLKEVIRFEDKYGMTNEDESVQKEVSQYEIGGHLPNIANGTIQASRELVLRGWLAGRDIDFGTEVDLTRTQLWKELSKASSDLFRSLGKDAINDFFGLQKLCSFRRGRPKEGI